MKGPRPGQDRGHSGRGDGVLDDPFLKGVLRLRRGGRSLDLLAPHSAFASSAVDEGTLLLLDHLPPGEPRRFLDLGCGYGALGIPVALAHPSAHGLLADRDLLAVEFARRNAERLGAASVEAAGSLGYRDVPASRLPFDWILLNAPARAGDRALEHFIAGGRRRLAPGGEMRVVVIRSLAPAVREIAGRCAFEHSLAAERGNHAIFAFPAPPAREGGTPEPAGIEEDIDVYHRDVVDLRLPEHLRLERPTDLADEPHRLPVAVPLLAERLPAEPPARALAFRAGYGLIPALLLARYADARVVAADRDLLGTAFTRRNCAARAERLEVVESVSLTAASAHGPFDLVVGETLSPLGPRATVAELEDVRRALAPAGRALVLGLHKEWREFLRDASARLGLRMEERRGPVALYAMGGG